MHLAEWKTKEKTHQLRATYDQAPPMGRRQAEDTNARMAQYYKNFPVIQGCLSLRGITFLRCETLHSRTGTSSWIPLLCSEPSFRLEGSRCQQEALPVLECSRGIVLPRGPPNSAACKMDSRPAGPRNRLHLERAAILYHVDASCFTFSDLRGSNEWVSGTQSALSKYVLTEQMKMHTQFSFGANDIFQVY